MTNSPVALFCGTPKYLFGPDDNDPSNEFGVEWVPKPPDESMLIAANLLTDFAARGLTLRPNGDKINCTPRDLLTDADRQAIRDNRAALLDILICGIAPYVYWDNWMWIWNCPSCNHSKLEFGEGSYDSCPKCNATGGFDSPRLKKAYDAAKQARFEHGETPRF
jgi:hypothetical protein